MNNKATTQQNLTMYKITPLISEYLILKLCTVLYKHTHIINIMIGYTRIKFSQFCLVVFLNKMSHNSKTCVILSIEAMIRQVNELKSK
jgi:hypothetical protein